LVASVDSSSIDMLAGLSKWSIFEDPALLLRRCRPHGQQQRARCREHAKISLHFVRLLFVTPAEKTRIAAVPALFGLPCRQQRQRGYHLSDKRNRGSVSTFDRVVAGPPCRKRLLVEPEVFEARAAHSRAFRQLMSLKVESADLESPDLAPMRRAYRDREDLRVGLQRTPLLLAPTDASDPFRG